MKKGILLLFAFFLGAVMLMGCQKERKDAQMSEISEYYIYYLDNKESQLTRESYKPQGVSMQEQLAEYADALREKKPDNLTYKKALPDYVSMRLDDRIENEQLTVFLDSNYLNLTGATEILCRAAIVKTLCQVEGVRYVQFVVDGQPLKDSNDVPVGFMQAEDFIDNTGGETKYEQNAMVTLYFADDKGTKLVNTRVKIKYDGTISLEQLVISQLIKGPKSIEGVKEGELLGTIPGNTVMNKITVKDGICYLDLNADFLKGIEGMSSSVIIYSIVNTLIEIPEINKVQFSIDGNITETFGDIKIDVPLERNLDIVIKE